MTTPQTQTPDTPGTTAATPTTTTAPTNPATAATPLAVRVPMEQFFQALTSLLRAPGPFASFYLPVHDDAVRSSSSNAIEAATNLTEEQRRFAQVLLQSEPAPDDAMLVGLLAADGTSFVQSFPEGPDHPVIEVAPLPRLAAVVEAEQRLRHHLLAVVTDEGVDVLTFPRHGKPTLHRAEPGDAAYAALLISEAAKLTQTPLVLIAAEDELAADLVDRVSLDVPIETRVQVVDVDGGLADIAGSAVSNVANARAVDAVNAIRQWKFERSHGLAAGGVPAALQALRRDDVRMVLISDAFDDQRQAWFGPAPTDIAMDLEDAASVDDLDVELVPARLTDAVIRSALLRGIPVSVVPELPDETLRDGLGVLRSTLIETIPTDR